MTNYAEQAIIELHLEQILAPHFNADLLLPALRDRVRVEPDGDQYRFTYYSAKGEQFFTPETFLDEVLRDDRWKAAKITHQRPSVEISDPQEPNTTGEPTESRYGAGYFSQRTTSKKLVNMLDAQTRLDRARQVLRGKGQ